jgi:hypothetical protein
MVILIGFLGMIFITFFFVVMFFLMGVILSKLLIILIFKDRLRLRNDWKISYNWFGLLNFLDGNFTIEYYRGGNLFCRLLYRLCYFGFLLLDIFSGGFLLYGSLSSFLDLLGGLLSFLSSAFWGF